MQDASLKAALDSLVNAMNALGIHSVVSPHATTREGVLVVAGSLFAELVGAVSQAQYAAGSPENIETGELAFAQGWATLFETVNSMRGQSDPVGPHTQIALLATFMTLAAKVVASYNPADTPDPILFAAAAAVEAGADLLVFTTFDRGADAADADTVHSYMHEIYEGLARAQKALFYAMTHHGPYTEEEG